jgi:thiosulfate dehydrogenase [quinone] large subunit
MNTELFGRTVRFEYSERWVGYALFVMRISMGWVLFQGGITKVLDPTWSAGGFLRNAIPAGNPLSGFFVLLANDWLWLIDPLNQWGLTLTGLGLLLGAFVRWNAFWGAVMMMFYWLSALHGGLLAGLPVAHGWVVDDHLIYAVLLFGIGAFGAGRILGLDARIEESSVVQNNPWLRLLLG